MDKLIFDIETTGPDASKDRIVQLAIKVVNEENEVLSEKAVLLNPEIPISEQATAVHGIKNADVKGKPTFKDFAKALKTVFENKIIVTYNGLAFDIPILMNEFERAGVEIKLSGKFMDVYKIEQQLMPKTLSAVYKRYSGEDLTGAHDALADVNATEYILNAQAEKADATEQELIRLSGMEGVADYYGKLFYDKEERLCFNFGKHRTLPITLNADCENYANWILGGAFPKQVKDLIREEQKKEIKKAFTKPAQGKFFSSALEKSEAADDLPF